MPSISMYLFVTLSMFSIFYFYISLCDFVSQSLMSSIYPSSTVSLVSLGSVTHEFDTHIFVNLPEQSLGS